MHESKPPEPADNDAASAVPAENSVNEMRYGDLQKVPLAPPAPPPPQRAVFSLRPSAFSMRFLQTTIGPLRLWRRVEPYASVGRGGAYGAPPVGEVT